MNTVLLSLDMFYFSKCTSARGITIRFHSIHSKAGASSSCLTAEFDHEELKFLLFYMIAYCPWMCSNVPLNQEHNDRSFYLELVAPMGRSIHGVYVIME